MSLEIAEGEAIALLDRLHPKKRGAPQGLVTGFGQAVKASTRRHLGSRLVGAASPKVLVGPGTSTLQDPCKDPYSWHAAQQRRQDRTAAWENPEDPASNDGRHTHTEASEGIGTIRCTRNVKRVGSLTTSVSQ